MDDFTELDHLIKGLAGRVVLHHRMETDEFGDDPVLSQPFLIGLKQSCSLFALNDPSAVTVRCREIVVLALF